jgi:hypothetical protein
MAVLQRSATVKMPIDRAERFWTRFVAHQIVQQHATGESIRISEAGTDAGTVSFNDAGGGKTEVTIELDPKAIGEADESAINVRVDSYLDSFKQFAEQQ